MTTYDIIADEKYFLFICENQLKLSHSLSSDFFIKINSNRVIFMEDHIPMRPDKSKLLGSQTSKWSLCYGMWSSMKITLT